MIFSGSTIRAAFELKNRVTVFADDQIPALRLKRESLYLRRPSRSEWQRGKFSQLCP